MNKITLLSTLFLNVLIFAQPVLNQSDIAGLNIDSSLYTSQVNAGNVGNAGANQIWNFSSLTLTPQGTSTVAVEASAPFSANFPSANFYVTSYTLGNTSVFFGYYLLNSTKLEVLGTSSDTAVQNSFTNPRTAFIFPFTFNSTFTDTYQISSAAAINSTSSIYDAYGTLTTAFGTFTDVIRIKTTDGISISYNWFQVNPYRELLSANTNSINTTINYNVRNNNVLATIPNNINDNFAIFPNPTNGEFTIKNVDFSNNEFFANVYDIRGNQIIKNEKIDSNSKILNIKDYASGLYFIKITDANNAILYSDKIIKN